MRLINSQGFTLVELMVVVTIIAVTAGVGTALFKDAQAKSRDARRVGDINTIADTLEMHYNFRTRAYPAYQSSWFANGKVPFDPLSLNGSTPVSGPCGSIPGSKHDCEYCFFKDATYAGGECDTWGMGSPDLTGAGDVNTPDFGNLPIVLGSTGKPFILCANMEGTWNGKHYYCRRSLFNN